MTTVTVPVVRRLPDQPDRVTIRTRSWSHTVMTARPVRECRAIVAQLLEDDPALRYGGQPLRDALARALA